MFERCFVTLAGSFHIGSTLKLRKLSQEINKLSFIEKTYNIIYERLQICYKTVIGYYNLLLGLIIFFTAYACNNVLELLHTSSKVRAGQF